MLPVRGANIAQIPRRFVQMLGKKILVTGLASDQAINLKAKSSVALTRSGGRQIEQLSRHQWPPKALPGACGCSC
jgi:hypothetical protein